MNTSEHNNEENCQTFPAGTILVNEGDLSRKMFIIREGKARVFRKYLGQHVTLAIIAEGEIFGEMSFFDGEPRSASVEALTDLKAIVVSGEKGEKQVAELPSWVYVIFRTVAGRFRKLDKQVTVLQSVYEFQKKSFSVDNCAMTIYTELLRFLKSFELVCEHKIKSAEPIKREEVLSETEAILGKRFLSVKVFWNLLIDHKLIENISDESSGIVKLNLDGLLEFQKYLEIGITLNYPILSHAALAIIRKIITKINDSHLQKDEFTYVLIEELKLQKIFASDEGISELIKHNIVRKEKETLEFTPKLVMLVYTWQSIIKSFDYATVSCE